MNGTSISHNRGGSDDRGAAADLVGAEAPSRLPNYLFQCSLVTASLLIILLVEGALLRAAIVVAVASTAFTLFVVPHSVVSTPRNVVGGHAMAVIAGSIFAGIIAIPNVASLVEPFLYLRNLIAALSLGLCIFGMVITHTEHPPAAGTALGLVVHDWTGSAVVFIMMSVVALTLVRLVLKPRLINLI